MVLCILIITLSSELRFRWSYTLWKAYEILYNNILESISFDQVLGVGISEYRRIIWSLTKSASSCFVFWSLLSVPNTVFDDLVFFGKLMKFFTRIYKSLPHLIKFWASEYPDTVGSSGPSHKSASWCFVFWSLLSAPNSDFDDLVLFGKLIKFSTRIFRSPYH